MIEINNNTKSKIDLSLVKTVVEKFLKKYKINKNISIAFIGDKAMQILNKKYRGINKTTDILSFAGEDDFFGELIIDYLQIKRQYKKFNDNIEQELIFILVHGLFHLMGYDDNTEKEIKKMEKLGNKFIDSL